jgi:cysteine desulfurase/selenocysteine lyase
MNRPGPGTAVAEKPFAVERIRRDFPILHTQMNGHPLVYLDNAATSQKPSAVLGAIERYYAHENANIHRGVYRLSEQATGLYEAARARIARRIHAASTREVIFTRGTTESINLVAHAFLRGRLAPGDEVLISAMEHHSNIVPWQMVCEERGARLRVIPMNDAGELELDAAGALLTDRTKLLAVAHVSNALGTVNPVQELIRMAHERGVPVLLDGAQAVPHMQVDVRELDCEFYAFSAHKMYGPTGSGILYGKERLLEAMPPYQGGGDMIKSVTFAKTLYNDLPYKFEAGTPHIAGGIGFGAAAAYLDALDFDAVTQYEAELLAYGTAALEAIPGVRIIGTARQKVSVLSFVVGDIHPHDIGTILDTEGIAVRTGHHCAQPVMDRFGVPATVRASLALYNTREEIDALADGLHKAIGVFR